MESTYIRTLGDNLTNPELELFRLITAQETQQVKNHIQIHKKEINFSKKGNKGYNLLQSAVLAKNRNILACLLATRKCEPIDSALVLATEIGFQEGINVFLKYINSKKRLLNRRFTEPNIPFSPKSPPIPPTPEATIHEETTSNDTQDEDFEEELCSDSQILPKPPKKPKNDLKNGQLISKNQIPARPKFTRANTCVGEKEKPIFPCEKSKPEVALNLDQVLVNPIDILKRAAINEDYNTTATLLGQNLSLGDPTSEDFELPEDDCLLNSFRRLESLRAVSSATYISLTAEDPIKTAFKQSKKLSEMRFVYPEYQDEFLQLSDKNSQFAVSLLSLCKTSQEVQTLMQLKTSSPFADNKFGRLQIAVNYSQKKFISHSHCQQIATTLWLQRLPQWQRWSRWRKIWHVFFQALFMPFCSILSIFAPNSSLASSTKVPLNRFIYSSTSYSIFLLLLLNILLSSIFKMDKTNFYFHWLAFGYVLTTWLRILTNDVILKKLTVFERFWSLYEIFMYFLFTVSFTLTLILKSFDQMLIAIGEGLFAIGFMLAVAMILQWVQLHQTLGPFIIALSKIIGSLFQLFIVLLILYVSFTIGIFYLYRDVVRTDEDEEVGEEEFLFNSFPGVITALFWTIYGYGESNYPNINPTSIKSTNSSSPKENEATQLMGFGLWGLFHIACVTIVFNMLIALMTNTYQKVADHCDEEWKFVRTELWLYFFEESNSVPPPFNVLMLIKMILLRIFKKKTRVEEAQVDTVVQWRQIEPDRSKLQDNVTINLTQYVSNIPTKMSELKNNEAYSELIKVLIERYFQQFDVQKLSQKKL